MVAIILAGLAYLGAFVSMVAAYAQPTGALPLVLGVSLPTALLIVMWIAPTPFVVLYIVNFERWVYNDDDRRRFAKLMQRSHRNAPSEDLSHR